MSETEPRIKTTIFIKQSGQLLHLQPVQGGVLQTIMAQMAAIEGMDIDEPGSITELMGASQSKALEISERLFNYCAGWGVKEDPPPGRTQITDIMGIDTSQPNIRKAAWVRYELGASQEELGDLISIVIGLTFADRSENGQVLDGIEEEE